jgi:hypothetical protein
MKVLGACLMAIGIVALFLGVVAHARCRTDAWPVVSLCLLTAYGVDDHRPANSPAQIIEYEGQARRARPY